MKKVMIIIIALIILFISMYWSIYITMLPQIKQIGKTELERINQLIITHSYLTKESIYDQLIILERDNQQQIQTIHFDMIKSNNLCSEIVLDIENTYQQIENKSYTKKDNSYYEQKIEELSKEGMNISIPISTLLKLPIPYIDIHVKFDQVSSVSGSLTKKISNYGLNHIMAEVNVEITLKHTIKYPFFEQGSEQIVKIPILLEIYEGQLPHYYTPQGAL